MDRSPAPLTPARRRASVALLLLLLSLSSWACQFGGATSRSSSTTAREPTPTSTSTSTPVPPPPSPHVLPSAVTQQGDLQFRLNAEFGGAGIIDTSFLCDAHLVLTKSPQSLTATDLSNISTYLVNHPVQSTELLIPEGRAPSYAPLTWLNGGASDRFGDTQDRCSALLRIHNGGHTATVIEKVGVMVKGQPTANTMPYWRVDLCTMEPYSASPCGKGGGSNTICELTSTLPLPSPAAVAGGNIRAESGLQPGASPDGKTCTGELGPGDDVAIRMIVTPPMPDARLLYRAIPYVVTNVSTYTLTTFESALAFASPAQMECWGVVNGTVMPVQDGEDGDRGLAHKCE